MKNIQMNKNEDHKFSVIGYKGQFYHKNKKPGHTKAYVVDVIALIFYGEFWFCNVPYFLQSSSSPLRIHMHQSCQYMGINFILRQDPMP